MPKKKKTTNAGRIIKKAVKPQKRIVKLHSARIKEELSRNTFKNHMSPWTCTDIHVDTGLDFYVQIYNNIEDGHAQPGGKHFTVQLKASGNLSYNDGKVIAHPVETVKVRQWYESQLPVMFVAFDAKTKNFFYTWVDERLLTEIERSSPRWHSQEKVTIPIYANQQITESEKEEIRKYVSQWRIQIKKVISPGTFFDMRAKLTSLVKNFESAIKPFPFESTKKDLVQLQADASNAIYRIAMAGLSRVGKSSMINKLVGRPGLSPEGVWQTTGVPILIQPGKEERVFITFHDINKNPLDVPYSEEILREYSSHLQNEDNQKGVKEAIITLNSAKLERGVMFYDIPGLDDPNDDIMSFADYTASCSNAIVYIIDGSSARSGSFVFKNDYKKHIEKFARSKDMIFLVVNKIDELSLERLSELKSEIQRNLKKYGLLSMVSPKVYFLSVNPHPQNNALPAVEIDTVESLEADIWKYILDHNKIGFYRIHNLLSDLYKAIKGSELLIGARVLDANQKERLEKAIGQTEQRIPSFITQLKATNQQTQRHIHAILDNKMNAILNRLEQWLQAIPVAQSLPSDVQIREYLTGEGHAAIKSTAEVLGLEMVKVKGTIDSWVEENLKQVREIIQLNMEKPDSNLSPLEDLDLPTIDLTAAFGAGILSLIAGIFISPLFFLEFFFGGFFVGLFASAESRRAKRVAKMMAKIRSAYTDVFNDAKNKINDIQRVQLSQMAQYLDRKTKVYFADIRKQIVVLDKDSGFDYRKHEGAFTSSMKNIRDEGNKLQSELAEYLATVPTLSEN